jgi:hypothetical protein
MNIKIILFIAGLLLFYFSKAQSVEEYVVSSSGGLHANSNLLIEWSVGEVMTEAYTSDELKLFQGLHQPVFDLVEPPNNLIISSLDVNFGLDTCFFAPDTIFVAGNDNYVTVYDGGNLNLVAGKVIRIMDGFSVQHGGSLAVWIDKNGTFCGNKESTLLSSMDGQDPTEHEHFTFESGLDLFFRAYPNPTTGNLTVELINDDESSVIVELYSTLGNLIKRTASSGKNLIYFNVSDKQAGVYILRVSNHKGTAQQKIIKSN